MSVNTDKQSYLYGDTVTISGKVTSVAPDTPVTIMILNPNQNLVHIEQINISADGSFSVPVQAKGPLWIVDGKYTVRMQYGFLHLSGLSTFSFQSKVLPEKGVFTVRDSNGQTFELNYIISEGKIKDIAIEPENLALVLLIDPINDGQISLKIPRLLIDAKLTNGDDEKFLVFIDGNQIRELDEKSDHDFRTINLSFNHDDSRIQIIGTQVVPEFGLIVTPLVIITMTTGIIISRIVRRDIWRQ